MKRSLWSVVLVVAGLGLASPALAGGWAVSTLDSVPSPHAGEAVQVGFVIRQHGVTPVNPDGKVGITVSSSSGDETYFPATAEGEVGHYVAEVVFSEPGTFNWTLHQGWFEAQDLGQIEVTAAAVAPSIAKQAGAAANREETVAVAALATEKTAALAVATTEEGGYQWPGLVRLGLPAVAVGLGLFVVVDTVRRRRRRPLMA